MIVIATPSVSIVRLLSFLVITILTVSSVFAADLAYDSTKNKVEIAYDSLNRITNKTTASDNITYTYDYDLKGTLTNVTINNITIKYEYDERKRVTKETKIIDGISFEKSISYDSMDRIIEKRLPSDELEHFYNKQGSVSNITNYIKSANYNAFGSLLNRSYNNNLISNFNYNSTNNRLIQIKTSSLQQLDYGYDAVGNVMSITDSIADRNYKMGYDSLDRLVNTTINNDLYQYEYDSIGNIKRIVRGNDAKRLTYNGDIPHAPSQVIDYNAGAGAYSAKDLDTDNRNRTIEFFLIKETAAAQNNVNWSVNFGDNNKASSTIGVNVSSPVMVLVQNNYSGGGSYNLNISTDTDANIYKNKFGISIKSLELLSTNKTLSTIKLVIGNDISETAANVEWACNNGNKSSSSFTIAGNNNKTILIDYNYSSPGEKTLLCNVTSDEGNDNKTTTFEIKGLKIENYTITKTDTNKRNIGFNIKNYYHPLTVTWKVESDGQTLSDSIDIDTDEVKNITQNITYTTDGDKTVNITVSSGSIEDSNTYQFKIEALEIARYDKYNISNTYKITSFNIFNYWPSTLNVNWNITDPSIKNGTALAQNKSVIVIIAENYTTEGRKDETVNAQSGSFSNTLEDWFNIHIVQLLDFQVLSESVSSTVSEIIARTNVGNETISWQLDTGEENITSNTPIPLNVNKTIILIEHNYSSSGVYLTNASINSSSYSDYSEGVVIS